MKLDHLLEFLKIRREEVPLASLMTLYFFLAMACVSLIKSLQNAFYLGRVGFDWKLPALYVLLALISGLLVVVYRRLSGRYSRAWLAAGTLALMSLSLVVFAALMRVGTAGLYTVFYVWGSLFSVLIPTLGWMTAYRLYGTRRAKRVFGILGTGGILGGAFGGFYVSWMGNTDDPQSLLIQVAIVQVLMIALILGAMRLHQEGNQTAEEASSSRSEGTLSSLRFIARSPYLTYLAGIVLATACVTTLIDLFYKQVLEERYTGSPGDITQFFGSFLGSMFLASALFQLVGTNRVIRRLGIGAGLMALPLALLGANVLVLVIGAFWTVVLLKAADGCLRPSLHKTSVELLYVPVTDHRTLTVKGIVDLVVFRLGDALGAALFLGLASLPGSSLYWIGAGALGVTAIWIIWSRKIGHEYLNALRRSLEVRSSRSARRALGLRERVAEQTLIAALRSDLDSKVRFALMQLVEYSETDEAVLRTPYDSDVTLQEEDFFIPPVNAQSSSQPPGWLDAVTPLLEHPAPDIAATALHLLLITRPEEYSPRLQKECSGREVPDLVCLHYLDRYGAPYYTAIKTSTLRQWAYRATPEQAAILARLMGKIKRPELVEILVQWSGEGARETACNALRSLGRYRDWRNLHVLLDALKQPWSRPAAAEGLVHYGRPLVPYLVELAQEPTVDLDVKREIPRILARLPGAAAVEALMQFLYFGDPVVSYRALKGLNKIRNRRGLPFGELSFSPALQIWVREYYELLNLDILMGDRPDRAHRLARKAVRERLDRCTEKIFRGLELFLPPGDAYFSYLGFTGEAPALRENAIELIDLRIRGELRETILPIVTGYNQREVVEKGRQLQRLSADLDQALAGALFMTDPWLKCCIIAAIRSAGRPKLRERIKRACEDVDPLVRETAQWALENWNAV